MTESDGAHPAGFTLVELIIVLALLAVVTAIAMPSLSRSLHQRNLNDEAARLLAMTEYGRDEAVSQGVPMTLWLDPKGQRFGVEAKLGYEGDAARVKQFALNPDVHFEADRPVTHDGVADVMEFAPDGALSSTSIDVIRLVDRFDSAISLARTSDGWSYEIVKEPQ
jgi:type II secretion system protein H